MSEREPVALHPTKKQLKVFYYIKEFIEQNVYSPSYREVKDALNLKSVSTVATHVDALIELGYLEKQDNAARSLRVLKDDMHADTKERLVEAVPLRVHIDWLKKELEKRQADESLSTEAAILKAALQLLDQTDEKQV